MPYDPNGTWYDTPDANANGPTSNQQGGPAPGSPTIDPKTGAQIYPNGTPPPNLNPNAPSATDLTGWYQGALGRAPSQTEIQGWSNGTFTNPAAGADYIKNQIYGSGEAQAYTAAHPPPATQQQPPPAGLGLPNPVGAAQNISGLSGNGQNQQLVDLLMGRAKQSLNINPATDPIIRPQVDAYTAQATDQARKMIDSQAESGNPYATGALQNTRTQAAEGLGKGSAQMQASLVQNELTSRRGEIQNALSEMGSLLTAQQQMSLQQELGLVDAALNQTAIGNQKDQFAANFGLQNQNQNNFWDWLYRTGSPA